MAGPQDFFMPTAPNAYAAPLLDFANIVNLPQQYYKGANERMDLAGRRAFSGGLPGLQTGDPTADAIIQAGVKNYGVDFAKGMLPYLQRQQWSREENAPGGGGGGGVPPQQGGGTQPQAGPTSAAPSGDAIDQYGRMIKARESGSADGNYSAQGPKITNPNSEYYGDRAYGAYQVMGKNIPEWTRQVLGRAYTIEQFVNDPAAQDAVFRAKFGSYVAQTGSPRDAASMWFSGKPFSQGQYKTDYQPGQRGGTSGAAYAGGFPASSPGANATGAAGSPPAITGQPSNAGRAPGASKVDAAGNEIVDRSGGVQPASTKVTGTPGPIAAPPSGSPPTGAPTEPGTAAPQTVGAGNRPVPTTGTMPPPLPTANAAVPKDYRGSVDNIRRYIDEQNTIADKIDRHAQQGEQLIPPVNTTADRNRAAAARQRALKAQEALEKDLAPTEAAKNIQSGTKQQEADIARQQKFDEERRTAGEQHFGAIQGVETIHNQAIEPYAKAIDAQLNNPNGPWTGIGAHSVLDYNRAKAAVGGNPRAAQMQEAFQKNAAQLKLGIFNLQKMLEKEGGDKATRTFQIQAQNVNKATADFGNTPAGNRYLVEMTLRMGEQYRHIAQMARDYRADPDGPKFLDDKFYEKVDKYLATPREKGGGQLWNELEETNQHLIGAPHAPKNLKTQDELFQWQRGVGLEPGEPYRRPDGTYGCALGGKCK